MANYEYTHEQAATVMGDSARCLRDVLAEWGVAPDLVPLPSERWRCRIAAPADTDEEVAAALLSGAPCHPPRHLVERVHAAAGEDGVAWLTRPEWDTLPRPKLAFNSRWGRPGSGLVDPDSLVPVRKLSEVIRHADGDARNLQMFHRDQAGEPQLPVLPELLQWPLGAALAAPEGARVSEGAAQRPAVVLDRATRISQRGAVTCWHLDDCGELVFQAALPCSDERCRGATVPRGPSGRPAVKLFVLAPRWAYDWVSQDQEQNRTAAFAQLDLWGTGADSLPPPCPAVDAAPGIGGLRAAGELPSAPGDVLPVLWLALVEAGGRPLLLPPNLPHTVLTLQDCVMVEERRLSRLWLDDVRYFEERNRLSRERPISYAFVSRTLRDPAQVSALIATPLAEAAGDERAPEWLRRRALSALATLLDPGAEEGGTFAVSPEARAAGEAALRGAAWDSPFDGRQREAEAVCALAAQPHGVMRIFGAEAWVAYCHVGGAPRFGPVRTRQQRAVADRRALAAAQQRVPRGEQAAAVAAALLQLRAEQEAGDLEGPHPAAPAAGAAPPGDSAADRQLMDELF
eukprot:TRINITY_DN71482_c0_g1_i1.p1 TRINITY_DN71482_c0_g1~~TRINITY_DN71482_c0_g1_i1.p1  ORF type:complete len:572 (+),score=211.96 TRINITY_DN71482_c0_g1_i1:38-1753(+)